MNDKEKDRLRLKVALGIMMGRLETDGGEYRAETNTYLTYGELFLEPDKFKDNRERLFMSDMEKYWYKEETWEAVEGFLYNLLEKLL